MPAGDSEQTIGQLFDQIYLIQLAKHTIEARTLGFESCPIERDLRVCLDERVLLAVVVPG